MTKQINLNADQLPPIYPFEMRRCRPAARAFPCADFDAARFSAKNLSAELSAAPVCPSSDK